MKSRCHCPRLHGYDPKELGLLQGAVGPRWVPGAVVARCTGSKPFGKMGGFYEPRVCRVATATGFRPGKPKMRENVRKTWGRIWKTSWSCYVVVSLLMCVAQKTARPINRERNPSATHQNPATDSLKKAIWGMTSWKLATWITWTTSSNSNCGMFGDHHFTYRTYFSETWNCNCSEQSLRRQIRTLQRTSEAQARRAEPFFVGGFLVNPPQNLGMWNNLFLLHISSMWNEKSHMMQLKPIKSSVLVPKKRL